MNLFNFWKKKEEPKIEKQLEPIVQQINAEESGRKYIDQKCELCGKIIGLDKYTKKQGRFFHKKEFRQKELQAKRLGLV